MATNRKNTKKTTKSRKKSVKRTDSEIKYDREGKPHTLADYRKNHWKIPASVYRVDEKRTQVIHKTTYAPLGRPPSDPGAKLLYNESKGRPTEKGRAMVKAKQKSSTKRYKQGKMKKQSYTQDYISAMGGDW